MTFRTVSRRSWFNLFGQGSITAFSVLDLFTTALSAGSVHNTASEPGPGTRKVTDTGSAGVSITGGKIRLVGNGSWNARGFWLTPAVTREAGVVLREDFQVVSGSGAGLLGFTTAADANFSGYNSVGIQHSQAGQHKARRTSDPTSPFLTIDAYTSGAFYFVLRANGKYVLFDNGTNVELWWWDDWDNTASLYAGATQLNTGYTIDIDGVYVPLAHRFDIGSLAAASDSFNRSDGALGSTDGAGHAEANGGSGLVWAAQVGTWGIASNKAAASALAGGLAIATFEAGSVDTLIESDLVRSTGNAGIVARYADSNNYLRAYHDGTNAVLQQVVAGTPTTLITAAATYAANASIRLHTRGARGLLYYNDLYIGTTSTINAGLTGTKCGLYTTDTGNTLDNFICYRRTGYNALREVG